MANHPRDAFDKKPLSAALFAEYLLELVRQRRVDDVLRCALRAQLAMPHVSRYEVRLLEGAELRVAAGAARRLEARRPGGLARIEAATPPFGAALDEREPLLVGVDAHPHLGAPTDAPRCCIAPLREKDKAWGLSLSFWNNPPSPAVDERLLSREAVFSGHLALAFVHARLFEELDRLRASARPAPPEGGTRILRDSELRALEERNLVAALEACEGKVSGPGGAAERLGVRPSTLSSRIRALGLRRGTWTPGR